MKTLQSTAVRVLCGASLGALLAFAFERQFDPSSAHWSGTLFGAVVGVVLANVEKVRSLADSLGAMSELDDLSS